MKLILDSHLADNYTSQSQKIRVLTETWVDDAIFCPNCGCKDIDKYPNCKPVADFYCSNCGEDYELKSKRNSLGQKVVDGAYKTMLERLQGQNNPNFFFLNYSLANYKIVNFIVIPKHFFVPEIIEKRKPLSESARRSGWTGCNILLNDIPKSGKIFYVKNGEIETKENILKNWQRTLFLRKTQKAELKGWILDVMNCIDRINKREFTLQELYLFEGSLQRKHPENKHVKDKIRQQVQFLREKAYLEFIGRGEYRLK